LTIELPPQGLQPARKSVAEESDPLILALQVAVEYRPPFDKGKIAVDNWGNAQRRLKITNP